MNIRTLQIDKDTHIREGKAENKKSQITKPGLENYKHELIRSV